MQSCNRRKRAKGVVIKNSQSVCQLIGLMLFSIFMMTIADLSCLFVILSCLLSEKDVCCSLLNDKRILALKKKWRRRLGKRRRLTPIFANGQYHFLSILPSKVIFQSNTDRLQVILPRALAGLRLHFVLNFRTTLWLQYESKL